VTFGRAAVAGVLSALYLLWQRHRGRLNRARRAEWPLLGMTAFGVIVGFPLFLALALRHVPSTHGAVVTALLPLSTAVLGALWFRQRPSAGFWACAVLGSGLVLAYMVWRAGGLYAGRGQHLPDHCHDDRRLWLHRRRPPDAPPGRRAGDLLGAHDQPAADPAHGLAVRRPPVGHCAA
jgi:hypothetical protein